MAKNKGLTPKRKKIDRNPRVKHREKFRRAKIRRKGQVSTADTGHNIYHYRTEFSDVLDIETPVCSIGAGGSSGG